MVYRCGIVCVFVLCLGACDDGSASDGDDASGGTAGAASGSGGAAGTSGGSGGAAGSTSQGGGAGGSGTGGSSQCGGGNAAFTPAAIEARNEYCAARTAHVAACGTPDDDPTCPEVSCLERVYESDGFVVYAECQVQKECQAFLANDDDCFESATGELTPEIEEFLTFCEARLDECAPSVTDDVCSVVSPLIQRSIFCAVDACLGGACDAMTACLEQAPAGIPDCF
jgi:hypothetical protein